jgi:hypothetical protein
MWKVLTESDWAGYLPGSGCEMKFIGHDKAIIMEWVEDPATKVWSRTGSDVGTVEFIDDTWFIISYKNRNTAYLFSKSSNSFENSNGAVFTKSKINSFHQKN